MPPVDPEAVLRFIRMRGPVLPIQIAKEIGQNTMMAGAILSEMVSSGKLKVSKLKVGGSPLYYPPGQESRLMSFVQHLGAKERTTYELLRQQGIIHDRTADPITRVTLRAMQDFAVPLTATLNDQEDLYWRWYLLSDSQAKDRIQSILGIAPEPPSSPPPIHPTPLVPIPAPTIPEQPHITGSEYQEEPGALAAPKSSKPRKHLPKGQTALTAVPSPAASPPAPAFLPDDPFYTSIQQHLASRSIIIQSTICHKKGSDYACTISMPTPVGAMAIYCRALNKKRISDSDLANAFLQSQLHHLPCLVVSPGQLTKKAYGFLTTQLPGITFLST